MSDDILVTKDGRAEHDHDLIQIGAALDLFAAKCGANSRDHGFWQAFTDADWLDARADEIESIAGFPESDARRLRSIARHHRLMEIGTKLFLIVTELSEGFESLRKTGYEGHVEGEGNLGEELGDATIRIGDLAHMIQTHLGGETITKMGVNSKRPHLHGKQA